MVVLANKTKTFRISCITIRNLDCWQSSTSLPLVMQSHLSIAFVELLSGWQWPGSEDNFKNAFWHVELDELSCRLTTFETPFRKYRYLRLPYWTSPAPQIFHHKMHEALEGLFGAACIADDILIYGCVTTAEEAQRDNNKNLLQLLERCINVRINEDKIKLNFDSVRYMGHELTKSELKPDNRIVEAVVKMPSPINRQGVL